MMHGPIHIKQSLFGLICFQKQMETICEKCRIPEVETSRTKCVVVKRTLGIDYVAKCIFTSRYCINLHIGYS